MSISGTDRARGGRRFYRTARVYLAATAFCVLFDRIYALFAHGVSSPSLSLAFLYPLLLGALPFFALGAFSPDAEKAAHLRLAANSYHSGLAALTVRSVLQGILEIAGASSPYLWCFSVCGFLMLLSGVFLFLFGLPRNQRMP